MSSVGIATVVWCILEYVPLGHQDLGTHHFPGGGGVFSHQHPGLDVPGKQTSDLQSRHSEYCPDSSNPIATPLLEALVEGRGAITCLPCQCRAKGERNPGRVLSLFLY
jgi:hypothetical protein